MSRYVKSWKGVLSMPDKTNLDVKSIDPITRAKCMLNLVNDDLSVLNEMHKNIDSTFFRASKHELNRRKSSILFWFPEVKESEVQHV